MNERRLIGFLKLFGAYFMEYFIGLSFRSSMLKIERLAVAHARTCQEDLGDEPEHWRAYVRCQGSVRQMSSISCHPIVRTLSLIVDVGG